MSKNVRLIDANELIKCLDYCTWNDAVEVVEQQPTAYDVDKVIEQLGGMLQEKRKMYLRGNRDENRYFYEIHILEEVIDIIRAGEKE